MKSWWKVLEYRKIYYRSKWKWTVKDSEPFSQTRFLQNPISNRVSHLVRRVDFQRRLESATFGHGRNFGQLQFELFLLAVEIPLAARGIATLFRLVAATRGRTGASLSMRITTCCLRRGRQLFIAVRFVQRKWGIVKGLLGTTIWSITSACLLEICRWFFEFLQRFEGERSNFIWI